MGKTLGLVAMISEFGRPQVGAYRNSHTPQRRYLNSSISMAFLWLQALLLQVYNDEQFVACRVSYLEGVLKHTILVI